MKHIVKKWLAGILSVVMVFSLLPVMARAEEDGETPEKTAVEQVQDLIDALPDAEEITAETRDDVQARIDAIDAATTELTEDEAASLDTTRYDAAAAALLALDAPSALEQVQALIDALPDADTITADNRADVEAQLTAIDEAKQDLTDDELDTLDITRYMAAVEAILALDNMAGADEPATIATESNIKYLDWDDGQKKLVEKTYEGQATKVTSSTNKLEAGWYYVEGEVSLSSTLWSIPVTGEVHLILKDGCTLTTNSITVGTGNSLTIYGQSGQTGKLLATTTNDSKAYDYSTGTEYSYYAAIGGGCFGREGEGTGTITINGGNVTAKGVWGAAIGSGRGGSGGNITINGGTVTASSSSGAGIGGGYSGSGGDITIINGGTITAMGNYGAGIGGGQNGAGGTITINGGTITATGRGGSYGAGVGSFSTSANGNAVIYASSVSDKSNQSSWSCILFEGNNGTVYGKQTLRPDFALKGGQSLTVYSSASLTIPGGTTMTVPSGVTVTNNGTIYVGSRDSMNATLNNGGTINNEGTIDVWGLLTHGEDGIRTQNSGQIIYHFNLDVDAPTFEEAKYGYLQPQAQEITIKNTGEVNATITSVEIIGSGFILNTGNNATLETGHSDESWTVQPEANLSVGTHTATISVTYSSDSGVSKTATAEVSFTVTQATPTVKVSASGDPTYGSDITLTANVTAPNVSNSEITGNVTFKAGVQELGKAKVENGVATLTLTEAGKEKQKALFDNKDVTADYTGNANIDKGSGTLEVTVTAKALTYTVTADGKTYDGNTTVAVHLAPGNLVSGDSVTLTATGNLSSPDANTYDQVNLNEVSISGGADAKYYSVEPTATNKDLTGNVTISKATVTFSVSNDTHSYTGSTQTVAVTQTAPAELKLTETTNYEVYYTAQGVSDTTSGTKDGETDAGTYDVWVKLTDGTYTNYMFADNKQEAKVGELTISKVLATCDAPTANNSTYTGRAQTLVEAGVPTGGEMRYALGENGDSAPVEEKFSDTIPSETNAGTYYVWYYVKADANHTDSGKECVTVTIEKAPVSFEVSSNTFDYDTEAHTATVTQTAEQTPTLSEGDFTVTYGTGKGENETNVGTYDIYVTLKNDNFKFKDGADDTREKKLDKKLTINQAALTLDVSGSAITYGQTLSESELSGTATIKDSKTTINGTWAWDAGADSTYPSVKDNSEKTPYKVIFTPTSSDKSNFTTDSLSTEIKITVNKKELTPVVVASSVRDKIYDGNTSVAGGTLTFDEDLSGEPFSGNKPSATGNFEFVDKNVGTNKHVNVKGIILDNSTDYALKDTTIIDAVTNAEITAKEVTLTWQDFEELGYDKTAKNVTATTEDFVADDVVSLSYKDNDKVNAGTYTATASLEGEDAENYTISNGTREYTVDPAKVSFTIENEAKADWASYHETNDDPNPEGYKLTGEGTDYVLEMVYDSFYHTVEVKQTAGEAVKIASGAVNGFTVTYKKDGTGDDITEIRDAGTYDIMVNLTPTEGKIYNYAFAGQSEDVYSLKIGEITVEPYTVHVTWSHLKYVYHAHKMHPNVRVQNAFKADVQPEVVPDGFEPAKGYSGELLAFAETSDSKVGDYNVEVELYGTSAGNYTVDDNTETVTIVPAPVTFTVGDNIWVIDNGTVDRTSVTLRPTWGAVSTTPDVAVHHSYPLAGTKLDVDTLNVTIEYWQNGEKVEAPSEAGKYEVWVKIGNENYRHSATETGELHHVGELVITDDPNSIRTYTVTFDPGYEGAPEGPAAIKKAFPNQTVVLPPVSGENGDGTTYDMTRKGYSFLGWSYNGHTYQPNEELHMPAADVTFKGEWIEAVPIGGRVVQESSGGETTPVNGATVVLKQGSEPTAEAVTGSDGSFDFGLVTPGIYNLEVTYENGGGAKIVKTFLIEVGDSGSVDNEFVLPDTALNTVVEVAPGIKSAVSMDGMITDEAAADVYTESDKKTVEDGGTVEFKMSISETTLTDDQGEEIPVPEERISMVLDMKLTKTVTSSSGTNTTEITDSKIPVTTVIHLPAEIQGKSGYTVYRFHDEDGDDAEETMQTITTSKNENGEYLQVIRDGTAIELHAEFYSTYVLTWYQSSGGGATAYPVTLPENALNGIVTANYEKAVKNSVVTLTVTPDEGHVLGELTVTDSEGNAIALTDNGDGTYTFVMPDGGVTVKAVFVCEGGENCQSRKFTDLDVKAWYHDYTDYVIGCGLMHGVGGSLFDPNGAVTRAQMVTVLWNMSGDPVVNYYMTYSDVGEGAWYAEAIRWATSEGVVDGYGNGLFGPNDPITREQMAVMLYRYERKYGDGGFTGEWMYRLPFTDLDQISDWAFEAVAWCNMKGIITGKDGNRLDPKGPAKRCEMAAVLTRYCAEDDTENDTE